MEGSLKRRLKSLNEMVRLHGDESQHEQTDSWSNRDLIPLPPHRRTWGKIVFSHHNIYGICDYYVPTNDLQSGFITLVTGLSEYFHLADT